MKKSVNNQYVPSTIEPVWQSKWEKYKTYHSDLDSAKSESDNSASNKPFYNLMMFPYPSAEGLHIGGTRTFAGVDIYGRFMRMRGHQVFQPFGLDGFGIHAENFALKIGVHPMTHSKVTEKNFYRQIKEIALAVDWDRTVETYKKDYYKWTQWLFVQLFKKGLAYRKKSPVNFCPSCKTVLADEQVIDGACERCTTIVEKKNLEQWFFRITKYADRLLDNIDSLNWTEKVKIAQRNWIGRSEGARIEFKVQDSKFKVEVFTTAIDTIYGVTFMVVSPEHPLVNEILRVAQNDKSKEIEEYIKLAKNKSEIERQAEGKEKTGVFSGAYAINPFNNEKIPVWIADYVLMGYGTGAIMAVPAHDKRDYEFARKFKLPIRPVVRPKKDAKEAEVKKDGFWDYPEIKTKFADKSELFDSGEFSNLTSRKAKGKMLDHVEKESYGERTATYHLRDWLISRQRYWGPPIPMIYCDKCAAEAKGERVEMPGWYAAPEESLPVELPFIDDFKPIGTHSESSDQVVASPLGNHPEFYEVKCPNCGAEARRETDVSDTFLDSAWYFFRYISTEFDDVPFDIKRTKTWLPVHMYIGGAEHSVLHLLYARFVTMVFKDLGLIDFEEPFARFYAHGLIIKDGAKMSKSKGNVVGPDLYVKKYGADTLRMYLHFLAPFDQEGDFRDSGIEGMHRFLKRVWKLFQKTTKIQEHGAKNNTERLRMMHQIIKNVTEEMEGLRFNTAIAQLMIWYNFLSKKDEISLEEAEVYLKLLAPFAPYITEDLFQQIFRNSKFESIHASKWPTFDEKHLVSDTVKIPVQVNGKFRATIEVTSEDIEDHKKIEALAKKDPNVVKFLDGKTIKKAIYVKGKVMNFVV